MDVAKFIRTLGYIVYVALWLPVVVLGLLALPVIWVGFAVRVHLTVKEGLKLYMTSLKYGVQHDMNFIRTGEW